MKTGLACVLAIIALLISSCASATVDAIDVNDNQYRYVLRSPSAYQGYPIYASGTITDCYRTADGHIIIDIEYIRNADSWLLSNFSDLVWSVTPEDEGWIVGTTKKDAEYKKQTYGNEYVEHEPITNLLLNDWISMEGHLKKTDNGLLEIYVTELKVLDTADYSRFFSIDGM